MQKNSKDITITVSQGDLVELATRMMRDNPAVVTEAKNIALVRMLQEGAAKIASLEAQIAGESPNGPSGSLQETKEVVKAN